MDVMMYLGQATLDVIGLAGFDYDFKALSEPKNELAEAYRDMFSVGQSITAMAIFQAFFPGASHLVGSACCWERMLRLTRHPADEAYQSHQQQSNDSPEDWISRSSSSAATR
jgi:hypothetical protein